MIFWLLLKLEISYRVMLSGRILVSFLRVCRARDYCIGSKFWKFYLIKAGFIVGELVSSLVKVFRLFRLEQTDFFGVLSVDTGGRCTNILSLAGASVFVMPC
jgi:hypothetical protein